ncbi:MAG: radical SAM protein [Poseidonibacter sp.]|uniref:radical SAM protein n=1 Tax=Poseidonibacter sp. TaxID=2321188 RepID=UPI00359CC6BC
MINYHQPLYRPPAEANSIIIQATLGCSYNKCSFCTMYESKNFVIRKLEDVFSDIDKISKYYNDSNKLFLADGDALSLSTEHLIKIIDYAYLKFPKLRRVSLYASAFNLYDKSLDELKLLRSKGLTLIYYGIESGSFDILKKIQKPISNKKMIDGLNKAYEANLKISATVILGLAGKKYSKEHITASANLINQVNITYLSTLQLMLEPHTKQKFIKNFKDEFQELNEKEMLEEQIEFISLLNPLNKVIFRSNHVSNILPLAGTLPKDKNRLLEELSFVIKKIF